MDHLLFRNLMRLMVLHRQFFETTWALSDKGLPWAEQVSM